MITLMVVLMTMGALGADGWTDGAYSAKAYRYDTISACESSRLQHIQVAIHPPEKIERGITLIGRCEAPKDVTRFDVYFPASPKSPAKPEVKPGDGSS